MQITNSVGAKRISSIQLSRARLPASPLRFPLESTKPRRAVNLGRAAPFFFPFFSFFFSLAVAQFVAAVIARCINYSTYCAAQQPINRTLLHSTQADDYTQFCPFGPADRQAINPLVIYLCPVSQKRPTSACRCRDRSRLRLSSLRCSRYRTCFEHVQFADCIVLVIYISRWQKGIEQWNRGARWFRVY